MKERDRVLLVVGVVLLLSVLVWFNYSAVLPAIIDQWGLSGFRAGVVFAAFQAGYLIAIIPMGILADRYPARGVIAVGASGTGLSSLMFGMFAEGILLGSGLRLLAGMFMAGVYVPGMRFLSDWYPPSSRGRAMGIYVGAYSFSSGLSFLLASQIMASFDWQTAIIATSIGAIGAGPLMVLLVDNAKRTTDGSGSGFDLSILRDRTYIAAIGVYSWHSWEVFAVRNWMLVFLVAVPVFANGHSPVTAGTVVVVMLALGGFGNVLGGWLSDKIGRIRTIGLALGASATLSATMTLFSDLPLTLLTAVVFIYGITLTDDSSPISTSITEIAPDDEVGTALSIQSLVGYFFTVVSPIVFGIALDYDGFALAFITLAIGAGFGLLCLVAMKWSMTRTAGQE